MLLLPTYWEGEGYPGIIIEALSVGLPILTTTWKQIPEMVNSDCAIMIKPKSIDELVFALTNLSVQKLDNMRLNAKKQFDQYDSTAVHARFFEAIRRI